MHENNYQQLYNIFFDFCSKQKQTKVSLPNSLRYSESTSKIQPFELLVLYLFEPKFLGSIHLNLPVRRNLDMA